MKSLKSAQEDSNKNQISSKNKDGFSFRLLEFALMKSQIFKMAKMTLRSVYA